MRPEHAFAFGVSAALLGCGASETRFDAPACSTLVTAGRLSVDIHTDYEMLFVVDDSPSMVEEQASLQRELPGLVRRMLEGGVTDGRRTYLPATNVHIAVVSADLGTAGGADAHPGCSAWGDEGSFQHTSRDAACKDAYPEFLAYEGRPRLASPPSPDTPESVTMDFACIASPGTTGCGYVQPLESASRALRPAEQVDSGGDDQHAAFLRSDPRAGQSVVGIVIVTDQDDCSVADPTILAMPAASGIELSPAARCAASSGSLFPVARLVDQLRALRAPYEYLVMVSVIAGVPEDLVANVPPGFADHADARDRFYDALLADPRMQPVSRPDGTLSPACESEGASATPAPRLVEAARDLGVSGRVLSICQHDWSLAIDWMMRATESRADSVCFPRAMPRSDAGLISCEVVWELSTAAAAPSGSPTRCDEVPALLTLDAHRPTGERGGQRCIVPQLAVTGPPEARLIEPGFGWYYDDFSVEVQRECHAIPKQDIMWSPGAEPPRGAQPSYECVQTQMLDADAGELVDAGACRVPG